jgi:hypothetical protein
VMNQPRIAVETLHAKNGHPTPALIADSEDDREAALVVVIDRYAVATARSAYRGTRSYPNRDERKWGPLRRDKLDFSTAAPRNSHDSQAEKRKSSATHALETSANCRLPALR